MPAGIEPPDPLGAGLLAGGAGPDDRDPAPAAVAADLTCPPDDAPADLARGGSGGAAGPVPAPPVWTALRARPPAAAVPVPAAGAGLPSTQLAGVPWLGGSRSGGASLADAVPADAPHARARPAAAAPALVPVASPAPAAPA